MEGLRNAYSLAGKADGSIPIGKTRHGWRII
jgi:hypothetical protein